MNVLKEGSKNKEMKLLKRLFKKVEQKYIYFRAVKQYKKLKRSTNIALPRKEGDKLVILGNGPSQKLFWENKEKFKDYKILCMNEFPVFEKEKFISIKPDYYCAIDPVATNLEKAQKYSEEYYDILKKKIELFNNDITWDFGYITWSDADFIFDNRNIRKIGIPRIVCDKLSFDKKIKLFSKNMATVNCETVAELAVFFGITFGFEEICIFGVDCDFQIHVDEKNEIKAAVFHSYSEKAEYRSIRGQLKNHYLYEIYEGYAILFKEFVLLRKYAEKRNVKVYNYNVESMVDAFEKKKI